MTENIVKGFKDIIGKDAEKFLFIKEIAKQVFEKYNYNYVETPIIEAEDFVKSGADSNDDVISEIFRLKDRGERNLALRYEFTFQLKRLFTNQKLPWKRYQIGPVFRDEPTKANRFKQFTQCDIDVIGAKISDQAEILVAVSEVMKSLGIEFKIYVNNRKLLNEILDNEGIIRKTEAIRELDKLDKLPLAEIKENLKAMGAEKLIKIVKQPISEFNKYENFKEILELTKYCKMYGVEIIFSPTLARGLSYYTGNIFEIKSNIKETICGGGTYLIRGRESSGISFSIERLMAVSNIILNIEKILIVSLGEDKKSIALANSLRKKGKNVSVYFGKPGKALDYANSYEIKRVIFVGKKEVKEKKYKIKDLTTGKEKLVTIRQIK